MLQRKPVASEEKGDGMGRLDGRVAVVTGAGRGIGAAEAVKLAQEGADVAVLDLSAEAGQETRGGHKKTGAETKAIAWDVSSAKAGLQAMARTLALELGRYNINVNAVAPGWIETEMTKEAAERVGMSMEEMKERFAKNIPLRRFGRVEDVANVVAFLVSDEASYISGETIYVAGGPASSVI